MIKQSNLYKRPPHIKDHTVDKGKKKDKTVKPV